MFEVEVKSILDSKQAADDLKQKLYKLDGDVQKKGQSIQLTHYFDVPNSSEKFLQVTKKYLSLSAQSELKEVLETAGDKTLRTRETNGKVLLIAKVSTDGENSTHGISRLEFEKLVDTSLNDLDARLLDIGLAYKSKWSRNRESFTLKNRIYAMIDYSAGYGYMVELEKQVTNKADIETAKTDLRNLLPELDLKEANKETLEKMYRHYSKNWQEYYQTDKTFKPADIE